MTPTDLSILERALSGQEITSEEAEQAMEAVEAMRKRDWAHRVLDAYSDLSSNHYTEITSGNGGFYCCWFRPCKGGAEEYDNRWGKTRDAARLSAAQSVIPDLSAEARATLGACP